jgi:hypothetical protein
MGNATYVAYLLTELYLCPEMSCRTVTTDSVQCLRCHATHMSNLAALIDGERNRGTYGEAN